MRGLNFEDVAVTRPNVKAAAYAAVGADGLGALDALIAHFSFNFTEGEDGAVADGGLNTFDDFNHVIQGFGGDVGEVAGVAEHGFFHERVAGADGDAVAAADAGRAFDFFAVIPKYAGVGGLPVDGEGLIDLHILTGFYAATAEDALVCVIAVEGVGHVFFIGLFTVGTGLVLDVKICGGVVDGAVLVVVVADGAVEHVVLEDAVKGLALGNIYVIALCGDLHVGSDRGGAGADELAVYLDHAGVAGLDGAHLGDVADLRCAALIAGGGVAIEGLNEPLAGMGGDGTPVYVDSGVRCDVGGGVEQGLRRNHVQPQIVGRIAELIRDNLLLEHG